MANFANMSLADNGATARVFEARLQRGVEQQWRYPATANVMIGDHTIDLRTAWNSKDPSGVHRVTLVVSVPLIDAPAAAGGYTPAPKTVGTTRFLVEAFLPGRATAVDRQNAIAYLKNALANTQVTDAFVNLSPPQ